MKKKYKGIDLFCGIGGFRLAMNSSQVECVFSSDNDKFAQQTYEANFHEVPTGDIKAVDEKDIPKFDILTAGFPCQPFSYAGEKLQSPNQKIPDRKTKCVIKTHINIKQNVIFSAKLKPV